MTGLLLKSKCFALGSLFQKRSIHWTRLHCVRTSSFRSSQDANIRRRSTLYYLGALGVMVTSSAYAAVPLYRIFCQVRFIAKSRQQTYARYGITVLPSCTARIQWRRHILLLGATEIQRFFVFNLATLYFCAVHEGSTSFSYGGTVNISPDDKNLSLMPKVKERAITVQFNADHSSSIQWNFHPRQSEIVIFPGETALAFYRAENQTSRPVDGISTYNVVPFEAGQYFNKIQCFCFEEQRLNPGETVELPVFFYIDPEFAEDPRMENVDKILLSYTFFEAKELPSLTLKTS